MRIGILTQPPHTNYGCILQAYALQAVLQQMGHKVNVFNTNRTPRHFTRWEIIKGFVHHIISSIKNCYIYPYYNIQKEELAECNKFAIKTQNTERFVNKYINQFLYRNMATDILQGEFDAIVVGSDQVWRPAYCRYGELPHVYLKFAENWKIKRIGYAISFGTEEWEYSKRQTRLCRSLAKRFDALSFREHSGVVNCKKYFGINSVHVIDPTMLHSKEHYQTLFPSVDECDELFCYVLDKTTSIEDIIDEISKKLSLKINKIVAPEKYKILPGVEEWLQSIERSKYVITDSFHGCVFSIIFNKPFWVIGNKARGQARFDSLLKMFQLEDRHIKGEELQRIDFDRNIDWESVNKILLEERKKATLFLTEML